MSALRLRCPKTKRNASPSAPDARPAARRAGGVLTTRNSAAMTARKLAALAPNTQAGPPAASRKPASAGPTKRAI
jgi:hypothetical protein